MNTKEFKKLISLHKLLGKTNWFPILNCIKFEEGKCTMTNLHQQIVIPTDYVGEPFIANLNELNTAAVLYPNQTISFKEGHIMTQTGRVLLSESIADFPNTLEPVGDREIISVEDFNNIKTLVTYVADEKENPKFTQIYITDKVAYACNTYIARWVNVSVRGNFYIPVEAFKIFDIKQPISVGYNKKSNQGILEQNELSYMWNTPLDDYPNIPSVLPDKYIAEINIPTDKINICLKKVKELIRVYKLPKSLNIATISCKGIRWENMEYNLEVVEPFSFTSSHNADDLEIRLDVFQLAKLYPLTEPSLNIHFLADDRPVKVNDNNIIMAYKKQK